LEALEDRCAPSASTLDPSFNATGFNITSLGPNISGALAAVAVQPDGKIVAVGTAHDTTVAGGGELAVVRYTTDGVLDKTFNGTGQQLIPIGTDDASGACVALQSDGRIVIGGSVVSGVSTEFVVARLNSNGSLDTTFDGDGILTLAPGANAAVRKIAIQTAGTSTDIVLAGDAQTITGSSEHQVVLMRLLPNGSVDTSFNGTGTVIRGGTTTNRLAAGLKVFSDGTILVGSTSIFMSPVPMPALAFISQVFDMVNSDGSPDTSFGNGGSGGAIVSSLGDNANVMAIGALMQSMDVGADGKIVTVGSDESGIGILARYNGPLNTNSGVLDTTFNKNGMVVLTSSPFAIGDGFSDVKVDASGKILVIGGKRVPASSNTFFAVARYTSSGVIDTTFGTGGFATYPIASISTTTAALDASNRLLLGGTTSEPTSQFIVARLGDAPPMPVNLVGTSGNDTLTITATDANHLAVTLNGITTTYDVSARAIALSFDGLAGIDAVIVNDKFNPTLSILTPGTLNLDVAGKYHVNTAHTEHINVYGKSSDTAYLYDSAGNDSFVSTATYATMTGTGFSNIVVGQGTMYGVSSLGGHDVAYLYDSGLTAGSSDRYLAGPTYAMYQFGNGLVRSAHTFAQTIGVSTNGGDSAVLTDSASGDTLYAYPSVTYFLGAGMDMVVANFTRVDAYAASRSDHAVFFDSAGNDSFVSDPSQAYLIGPRFFNIAHGFGMNQAFATHGGNDTAMLVDNAGNAKFVGTTAYAYLAGTNYFDQVQGFGVVTAMTQSHGDIAFLYDSAGNDAIFGSGNLAKLTMSGLTYNLFGFDAVVANRSTGLDTEHIGAINYIFSRAGGWVAV
jgi:uncharacterized delta-60 repeat protein